MAKAQNPPPPPPHAETGQNFLRSYLKAPLVKKADIFRIFISQ